MNFLHLSFLAVLTVLTTGSYAEPAKTFDWPQWQGPDRNGISKETGLLKEWPEDGPALAWKVTGIGGGYSATAIASGKIYGMSKRDEEEVIWALSEKDGSEIWAQPIGTAPTGGMRQGSEGAGCSPTVDGEHLYAIGMGGEVVCLNVGDGKIVWQRNLIKDFGGRLPTWRFNESPLIDGDKVICTPGGIENTIVALNKLTGDIIWKSKVPDDANAVEVASPSSVSEKKEETPAAEDFEPEVLLAAGSTWKYSDSGASPGADWATAEFKDDAWSKGAAQLGYGDRDEATTLDSSKDNYPTYYFRQQFEIEDPSKLKPLVVRLLKDDGAIVYLNGKEIVRDNMPDGKVTHDTFARGTTPNESGFYVYDLAADELVVGKNILAVEVHQADANSSDVSFDLELREKIAGKDKLGAPAQDRRRGGRGGFGGRRRGGGSGAGYSSAIAIDFEGQRQYVQFTSKTVAGVSAADGKLLWRYDKPSNRSGINCSTPIYLDGRIFAASAYGAGGGLAQLSKDSKGNFTAKEVWFSGDMENHHGGMIVIDGSLYGANGGNGGGFLACLDFKTGDVLWDERDGDRLAKKGSIAYADERIYYRTEDGDVLLIEPNAKEYIEHGRFKQPDRTRQPAWTHPVIANGRLYVRDQDTLYCYDISKSGS